MECDMPKPCKFQFLNSSQKRLLWTYKKINHVSHPVVGLVLQVGDAKKFPLALGFESLDPVFTVSKQGPCFTVKKKMELFMNCQ